MYLTGKEIKDLAEYAGFTVSVDDCPKLGVQDDDGKVNHYSHVVTCDGCADHRLKAHQKTNDNH